MILRIIQNPVLRPVWFVIRVALGVMWVISGYGKLADPNGGWVGAKAGTAIRGFWIQSAGLAESADAATSASVSAEAAAGAAGPVSPFGWYRAFLQFMIDGHYEVGFSYMLVAGEILVGIGLIFGVLTTICALMAAFMNLNFMFAGTVSTNPILYTAAILLVFAGYNAGAYGFDRVILPYINKLPIAKKYISAINPS
jgi:thiosulfate dehydrogenase [quinone] large subunit